MEVNPHIAKAIHDYKESGKDFHEVMSWHLLHGIVMTSPEFLCVGYFCDKSDLSSPLCLSESDTGFVSYMTGDMAGLKGVTPDGMTYIAFERGFRNCKPAKTYPIKKFLQLIN